MSVVKSRLLSTLPGLRHGFGTIQSELDPVIASEWSARKPVWKQVHGIRIAEVLTPGQDCGETDGLCTFAPSQPIAVVTADCVPILLARIDGRGAAALHAGWRGSRGRIVEAFADALRVRGQSPGDWLACIGPAIGPCCYEVSEELAREFAGEFGESCVSGPGQRMLDLRAVNAMELNRMGFRAVEVLRLCTRCGRNDEGQPIFHSYRRAQQTGAGSGGRQFSMIETAPKREN